MLSLNTSKRAEAAQKHRRRLVYDDGYTDNYGDNPYYAEYGVEYAAQGEVAGIAFLLKAHPCERAYRTQRHADGQGRVDKRDPVEDSVQQRRACQGEWQQGQHKQRGHYMAASRQHMTLYQRMRHIGIAHQYHLAYGDLDEICQRYAHKHRHSDDDDDIDYLDKGLVPAEPEPIQKTMDIGQQPLGHRMRRDNVIEKHKRALIDVIMSIQRPYGG